MSVFSLPALTDAEITSLRLSLEIALGAAAAVTVPGIACGWFLSRRSFPGKSLLEGIVHAPLVMPPVVTGYLLLILLGRNGVIGSWLNEAFGITLAFSAAGAAAASALVSFPLMVRSVRLAVDLVDPRLEEAARTLGASRPGTFFTVTLPLAIPGIVAGFVLAFARSLGEFGATITFAGNIAGRTQTLPMAIYTALQTPGGGDQIFRLTALSLLLCFLALAASEILARKARVRLGLES